MRANSPWQRAQRVGLVLALLLSLGITACVRVTPRVAKIGLVAPFDGRYREVGYDVIPAARLAVREWAAQHARPTGLAFELVAYDDAGDPAQAVEQARRLVTDPDVRAVIGHWREDTTQSALPIYSEAGLPLVTFCMADVPGTLNLAPSQVTLADAAAAWLANQGVEGEYVGAAPIDVVAAAEQLAQLPNVADGEIIGGPEWGLGQFYALAGERAEGMLYVTGAALPADAVAPTMSAEWPRDFIAAYQEGSLGAPPGPLAVTAYLATWLAMTRIAEQQVDTPVDTLANDLEFGEDGRLVDAPVFLYRWQEGQRELVERLR